MEENGIVITGIDRLGDSELEQMENLLRAYRLHGPPDGFYDEGVQIRYIKDEGSVILVNEDYDELIYNNENGKLERYYYTPYAGFGGTYREIFHEYDNLEKEDRIWFDTEIRTTEKDIEVMTG